MIHAREVGLLALAHIRSNCLESRLKLAPLSIASATLSACASKSGVVASGPDTFFVSRQAASGFSGMGTLKADALREADVYCASRHKTITVVETTESQPPYVLGNFPKVEVTFKCQ